MGTGEGSWILIKSLCNRGFELFNLGDCSDSEKTNMFIGMMSCTKNMQLNFTLLFKLETKRLSLVMSRQGTYSFSYGAVMEEMENGYLI